MLLVQQIPADASQHDTAHALLQEGLRRYAQREGITLPETFVKPVYREDGKPWFPQLPGVQFSLSHCRGLAAVLLSRYVCGVDAEGPRPVRPAVIRRAYAPQEARAIGAAADPDALYIRLWTLKEAYAKATGTGIACDLRALCFSLEGDAVQTDIPDAAFVQRQYDRFVISACILRPSS